MIDAEIRTYGGDEKITEKFRSGQVNWIDKTNEGGFFDSLNSRIESFTEYSLMESEKYQTVNYGLGGHFSGHFDPFGIKLVSIYQNKKLFRNIEKISLYKCLFTILFQPFYYILN